MANIIQPLHSAVKISPYSQRLLQYSIEDSKVYLSKATNSLLTAFTYGYDENFFADTTSYDHSLEYQHRDSCILDGLTTEYELSCNVLNVTVNPGALIVDSTLLMFPEPTTLDLDLGGYGVDGNCGKVAISVQFQWVDSVYEMQPKLRMVYIDPDDDYDVTPSGWWTDQDKLVICYFDYDKDSGNVIPDSLIHHNPSPFTNINKSFITIKGYPYEVGPLPKFWYNILDSIEINYSKRYVYVIPGCVDPTGLEESTVSMPVYLTNVEDVDLLSVRFNVEYDNTLVENPQIERGQAAIDAGKNATFTVNGSNDILSVDISGPNSLIIGDGALCYIKFDIKREVAKNTYIDFNYNLFDAIDITLTNVPVNIDENTPQIYPDTTSFMVERPSGGEVEFEWDECWKVGDPSYSHTGYRQFYADVDTTDLRVKDTIVQCYIDDFAIQPAAIQHVSKSLLRIWMPEKFIFESDPIPNMKVIVVG